MTGVVIFLGTVLVVFVVAAIVLIGLIVSLSRKISRTQRNVQVAQQNIDDLTNAVSVASSVAAIFGTSAGVLKNIQRSIHRKKAENDRKSAEK